MEQREISWEPDIPEQQPEGAVSGGSKAGSLEVQAAA